MRRNTIKQKTKSGSDTKTRDLIHATEDFRNLQRELRTCKQSLKATEDALRRLQKMLDLMTHNFPGGTICILNREAVDNLLGEEPVAHGGATVPVGNRTLFFDDVTLAQVKRSFTGENVFCELHAKGKFYQVAAVPLTDNGSAINEVLCVVQDLTDRKNLEEDLRQSLEKEKELGELKSRFVTMASHEFRTPLTMILSSTFLLENTAAENYESEKRVHTVRIKRAVNNLTLILNEFLSLEKLEQNKVEVIQADVNVPEFIQDTLSEMEILRREKQIVKFHHKSNQSIVKIDHHLLWSIVTNLISNALKYSSQGDRIEVTSAIENESVLLTVKDPGIGIPDDEQQFIFGRFFRARNAVNIEGTGLGLHIIQKYIHLLNGQITFESQLDVGTTFHVVLPLSGSESHPITNSKKI